MDVNVPGVIARLAAPLVAQLSVLLAPELMLAGFALNELIAGLPGAFTVMVTVDVAEPAALVAVKVYVVVADGFIMVEPVTIVDVNDPGVIATPVAPVAAQLSVLFALEFTLAGFAVNDVIFGAEPFPAGEFDNVAAAHPARPEHTTSASSSAQRFRFGR